MVNITVDSSKQLGKIKRLHEVGQPPFSGGFLKFDFSHMRHPKNAGITYSRLHEVGGAFGGNRFVDIPNIFRNFDADETDPASYDFAFTDELLKAMVSYDPKEGSLRIDAVLRASSAEYLNPELLITGLKRECGILGGDPTKEWYTIMRRAVLREDFTPFT